MTSTNATLPSAPGHFFNEGAIQLTGIFQLSGGVAEDLELHKYGLRQISVDPAHVQLAPDESSLAIWKDASRTADELRRFFSPKDARAWLDLANALDPAMDVVVAYMKSHPLRPWNAEMGKAFFARAARHPPKRLWSLRHMATASHTEFLEETFESELPKGALAAMAAFSQMRLDMTAWAMIYLGVVQKGCERDAGRGHRCAAGSAASLPARARGDGPHRQSGPRIRDERRSGHRCAARHRAGRQGAHRRDRHLQSGDHAQ